MGCQTVLFLVIVAGVVAAVWGVPRLDQMGQGDNAQAPVAAGPAAPEKPGSRPTPGPAPRGGREPVELLPPPVAVPESLPMPDVSARPPSPEEVARDRERQAGLILRAAREKLRDGARGEARAILEEVVLKFPGTKAAEEARALLGQE
jgi:hypothetical protein